MPERALSLLPNHIPKLSLPNLHHLTHGRTTTNPNVLTSPTSSNDQDQSTTIFGSLKKVSQQNHRQSKSSSSSLPTFLPLAETPDDPPSDPHLFSPALSPDHTTVSDSETLRRSPSGSPPDPFSLPEAKNYLWQVRRITLTRSPNSQTYLTYTSHPPPPGSPRFCINLTETNCVVKETSESKAPTTFCVVVQYSAVSGERKKEESKELKISTSKEGRFKLAFKEVRKLRGGDWDL